MKRIVLIIFLAVCCVSYSFSQTGEHAGGGVFTKRIESNFRNSNTQIINGKTEGTYNLGSKTDLEKLFFGDRNAMVEFFYAPPFDGTAGFRIVRDSADTSYILELKHISNYEEVQEKVEEMFPTIGIPAALFGSLPKNIDKLIRDNNIAMYPLQQAEKPKLYKVETLSFPVSDQFVEKLYAKTVSAIDNFKAKGKPAGILDGYRVTFRCVVGDELWTLNIHVPQGDILKSSDLFRQIITDTEVGNFDESKYIKLLKK